MPDIMTEEQYIEEFEKRVVGNGDTECAHVSADEIITQALKQYMPILAEKYEKECLDFWYA